MLPGRSPSCASVEILSSRPRGHEIRFVLGSRLPSRVDFISIQRLFNSPCSDPSTLVPPIVSITTTTWSPPCTVTSIPHSPTPKSSKRASSRARKVLISIRLYLRCRILKMVRSSYLTLATTQHSHGDALRQKSPISPWSPPCSRRYHPALSSSF